MKPKNIEWIFFDIGSTLVDENRVYDRRISETVNGSDISFDEFYNTMLKFYRENKNGYSEAVRYFGLAKTPWYSEEEHLYTQAAEVLEVLFEKYSLGIIANQNLCLAERLKNWNIRHFFNVIVASAEEGVSKPDLALFNIALNRANCIPENAVMIGDRLDNDIVPANTLGMTTIWVKQGFARFSAPTTELEIPNYTVESLDELLCILLRQQSD